MALYGVGRIQRFKNKVCHRVLGRKRNILRWYMYILRCLEGKNGLCGMFELSPRVSPLLFLWASFSVSLCFSQPAPSLSSPHASLPLTLHSFSSFSSSTHISVSPLTFSETLRLSSLLKSLFYSLGWISHIHLLWVSFNDQNMFQILHKYKMCFILSYFYPTIKQL